MKIDKITPELSAIVSEECKRFVSLCDSGRRPDREGITKGVNHLYGLAKLEKPLFCCITESPLGAQIALKSLLTLVHDSVDASVRASVRSSVSASVHASVGNSVGDSVGDSVYASVGASVRNSVRDSVYASVRNSVGASVGASVRNSVGNSVYASVRSSVSASVRDSVRASVRNSVHASVRDSVHASVRDSVSASVHDSVYQNFEYYGGLWTYWLLCWAEIWRRAGVVGNPHAELLSLIEAGSAWQIQVRGICVVSALPEFVKRDDDMRVHSENGPAIRFRDGWELYRLRNVRFKKELWQKVVAQSPNVKEVLSLQNEEQKMAAISTIGYERLLENVKHNTVHKSDRGNELFCVEGIFSEFPKAYFIKCTCPTTGRVYVEGVPPDIAAKVKNADIMQAMCFNWTGEQYRNEMGWET